MREKDDFGREKDDEKYEYAADQNLSHYRWWKIWICSRSKF